MLHQRLPRLLLFSHVGLVLLLAVLLLATGAGIISASLRERTQAQATQAAAEALSRLEDQRREVMTVAGLLSERPTLHGYLRRDRQSEAREFLEAFRTTARMDYVSVERGGGPFVQGGTLPPDPLRPGLQFDPVRGRFWYVEAAPVAMQEGARVVLARILPEGGFAAQSDDDARIRLISPLGIVHGQDAQARDGDDDEDELRNAYRHAWTTGKAETIGPLGADAVIRIEPVHSAAGEVDALVAVSVPRDVLRRDTLGWLTAFGIGSLAIATLAAIVAAWLARRISRPFSILADAARRLGVGDLETPVALPETELAEPAALARSLEGMRRQVRALTEQERRQRQELDTVLDGVGDGIVAVDTQEVIRYANRQFLDLLDRDEADVVGHPFDAVLMPAPLDGAAGEASPHPLSEARANGLAHVVGRYLVRRRPCNLVVRSAAPIGGRQVAIVREETSDEASRAMRDAILANLSHEFQTPLSAQIAAIELLRDHLRGGGDAVAIRLIDAQFRGALRLSQLVDNLLDSLRIESGEMRLRREEVDFVALVEDAIALMRPLLEQRDQRTVMSLPRSEHVLMGDGPRLSQVVVNLLANANKFAPDQSSIWVDIVWGDETVSLWIEDEGPGLPPMQSHADLFAPFRRAPDQEPSQRGAGLGLAIVRALVEQHRGQVVVAVPRYRQGARFGIVLPLES
ncbi:ATP-binding protein [Luteimonas sp. R10]|uniref:sensor histidine kinase n=1 Tax=Luteimonas sp. R10 TaxID=3108176 RepID=UPI00308CFBDF|nr:ATP-binding protein [Luteimonas sp. R10]